MKEGYFLRIQGAVRGPFTLDQLKTMRARGQLQRFHEISRDKKNWIAAGSVIELFPSTPTGDFAGSAAHPPSAPISSKERAAPQRESRFFLRSQRRVVLVGTLVCGIVLVTIAVAYAFLRQPPETPPPPPPPGIAAKARDVLMTHCFKCHGGEGTSGGLKIFERKSLTTKRKGKDFPPLTPGKPEQSLLWIQMDKDEMPPRDEVREGRPNSADREIIRAWILAGAPEPDDKPYQPQIIKTKDVLAAIKKHLDDRKEPESERHQRYFVLTNLHNRGMKEQDLSLHRAAFAKLVNSMTWERDLVIPKSIDKEAIIFPLDLRDLGWNNFSLLELIKATYPYGLSHDDDPDPSVVQLAQEITARTKTSLPIVRIDWFLARASTPPLYETFLDLPDQVNKLETKLNVKFKDNFRDGALMRAGFRKGLVSNFNRLLERHKTPHGAYWKSYDFKSNVGSSDLLNFPLGPQFDGNPFNSFAFKHAGGEMIFNLPNGMQAYYLTDEVGKLIAVAPEDVVRDLSETSGTPKIVNGLSCINCHREGIKAQDDEILAVTAKTISGPARRKVEELYAQKAKMAEKYVEDSALFQASAKKVTQPFLKEALGDIEPIGKSARMYLADLGIDEVASELGHPNPKEMISNIGTNSKLLRLGLSPLTEGRRIPRALWEGRDSILGFTRFQITAQEFKVGEPLR